MRNHYWSAERNMNLLARYQQIEHFTVFRSATPMGSSSQLSALQTSFYILNTLLSWCSAPLGAWMSMQVSMRRSKATRQLSLSLRIPTIWTSRACIMWRHSSFFLRSQKSERDIRCINENEEYNWSRVEALHVSCMTLLSTHEACIESHEYVISSLRHFSKYYFYKNYLSINATVQLLHYKGRGRGLLSSTSLSGHRVPLATPG